MVLVLILAMDQSFVQEMVMSEVCSHLRLNLVHLENLPVLEIQIQIVCHLEYYLKVVPSVSSLTHGRI